MSMLIPPHMMNTMVPHAVPDTDSFYADPIRNYMIPVALRPPAGLAVAPLLVARLAARARHVGRRGPHPPVPD